MKLRWKIALGIAGFFILAAILLVIANKNSGTELEKYKATLRAKGEILELDGLVPTATNTTTDLDVFVDAAQKLKGSQLDVGNIKWMHIGSPGRALLLCNAGQTHAKPFGWDELAQGLEKNAENLATIHEYLTNAPTQLPGGYKNFPKLPKNPFILKRSTAQWLAASALNNIHNQAPELVTRDIQALCALANMHSDDPTLVNAMIRVAIAGIALSSTWEAIYGITNWTEPDLKRLQTSLEQLDLLKVLEKGITGERNFGLANFESILNEESHFSMQGPTATPHPGEVIAETVWRNTVANEDVLFYLRFMQGYVEAARQLRKSQNYREMQRFISASSTSCEQTLGSWQKYRYVFSMISIPNFMRVPESPVRNETMRRFCMVAIALKRHQLLHGTLSSTLSELTPEFLPAVPIDPMDGQSMRYQLKSDGSYLLYSVGMNGKDEGGDPAVDKAKKGADIWAGRDAVWPQPALP